jgi:hypothetical protein
MDRLARAASPLVLAALVAVALVVATACEGTASMPGIELDDAGRDVANPVDAGLARGEDGGPKQERDGGEPHGPDDGGSADAGHEVEPGEFVEIDGLVSFEAEHYTRQENTEALLSEWYTFEAGSPAPEVTCVTNVVCSGTTAPACNEYGDCDGDDIDPADASGAAYVEALPDRRRTDHESGTGNIGVVNEPGRGPTLIYRVLFTRPGRYYVWGRARGQGPAANGLHVGIDGMWPRNELTDPSTMRMQFPSGWGWTQNRRGGSNHTGVPATGDVSRRDANIWLEIASAGVHEIQFAMREDGLELDKVVLALDPEYEPTGDGPAETR